MHSDKRKAITVFILSAVLYFFLQYFTLRSQYLLVFAEYACLFLLYLSVLRISKGSDIFYLAIGFAVFFRVLLIPSLPNLSDDFYRFIWDGQVTSLGINPFSCTPRELISLYPDSFSSELFAQLNSPDYHSVYPYPLQGLFTLSYFASPGLWLSSVIILKSFIVLAELITLALLIKLVSFLKLDKNAVLLYALNPLVIIELSGNIHFEALAIPFILFAVWLVLRNKNFFSGLSLAMAASLKLLPALFAPVFISRLKLRDAILWSLAFSIILFTTLLPLFENFLQGIGASLDLYFRKFEFNASIYYLLREIGFWMKGYNTIAKIGPALGVATFISVIGIGVLSYLKRITIVEGLIFSLSSYLLFATTVHPWYVIPLIALAALSRFRFPLVWSFFIFLTYLGYSQTGYNEIAWIVFAEYLITFGFATWEIKQYLWKKKIAS